MANVSDSLIEVLMEKTKAKKANAKDMRKPESKTEYPRSKQAIFTKVWNHFIRDKKPRSVSNSSLTCYYRSPDGAACAVGLFIPDDLYKTSMEGPVCAIQNVCAFYEDNKEYAKLYDFINSNYQFLLALQRIHDTADRKDPNDRLKGYYTSKAAIRNNFKKKLTYFAKVHKLRVPQ